MAITSDQFCYFVDTTQMFDEPALEDIKREVEEYFSPSLGGSANNSLTSGSLADISSITTSKSSSSETPSLQKLSSISSAGSNLTKTSSISSISRVDSSLGKVVVTPPGSNKTSPNTSTESRSRSGTPKMARSVSFQEDTTARVGQQNAPLTGGDQIDVTSQEAISSKSVARTTLTKAHTMPSSSPVEHQVQSEHGVRLTRSVTSSPTKHRDGGKDSRGGRKSVFPKSYTTPGKRGLRARSGANKTTPGHEDGERSSGGGIIAEQVITDDSEKDFEPKKKPPRRRRSSSAQRSGTRSSLDGQSHDDQSALATLPTSLPADQSEPMDPLRPQEDSVAVSMLRDQRPSIMGQSSSTPGQSSKSSTERMSSLSTGHSSTKTG